MIIFRVFFYYFWNVEIGIIIIGFILLIFGLIWAFLDGTFLKVLLSFYITFLFVDNLTPFRGAGTVFGARDKWGLWDIQRWKRLKKKYLIQDQKRQRQPTSDDRISPNIPRSLDASQ